VRCGAAGQHIARIAKRTSRLAMRVSSCDVFLSNCHYTVRWPLPIIYGVVPNTLREFQTSSTVTTRMETVRSGPPGMQLSPHHNDRRRRTWCRRRQRRWRSACSIQTRRCRCRCVAVTTASVGLRAVCRERFAVERVPPGSFGTPQDFLVFDGPRTRRRRHCRARAQ